MVHGMCLSQPTIRIKRMAAPFRLHSTMPPVHSHRWKVVFGTAVLPTLVTKGGTVEDRLPHRAACLTLARPPQTRPWIFIASSSSSSRPRPPRTSVELSWAGFEILFSPAHLRLLRAGDLHSVPRGSIRRAAERRGLSAKHCCPLPKIINPYNLHSNLKLVRDLSSVGENRNRSRELFELWTFEMAGRLLTTWGKMSIVWLLII